MNKWRPRLFGWILVCSWPALAPRADDVKGLNAETRLVLRAVSERYKKLHDWEANFTQDTYSVGLGKGTFNEGHFVFQAPNKFRYTLVSPEASDFICDGKTVWIINYPEGRKKPARVHIVHDLSQIELERYLIILRGIDVLTKTKEAELLGDFDVTGKAGATELSLELVPKKSNEISKILLVFRNDEPALNKTVITDSLGNTTTVILTVHRSLAKIDPKSFVPDYPKGSTVE